jgi:hypothetical protein
MKKNVLISFVTEADSDLSAVFALNKTFLNLPENELAKFDVFDVVDVVEEAQ